jgi:hypothetical protein
MIGVVLALAVGCSAVSPSEVKSTLGIAVGKPRTQTVGPATTCSYPKGTLPSAVIVRFQTGMTAKTFAADRKQFEAHGEKTKTVTGIGSSAYSSTLGSGSFAVNTLVVLKGSTEVLVTGPASLAKVTALMKKVLAKV